MMYQLMGINKRPEDAEDGEGREEATETQRAALVEVLGQERRDRVLSAVYIARHDVSGIVRIAAGQIFKTLVSNPQKTVREMLPTLTNMIVKNLASADEERRHCDVSGQGGGEGCDSLFCARAAVGGEREGGARERIAPGDRAGRI